MKLAVASGKGGTGKTMVAANLAAVLAGTEPVTLVDCDAEAPNLHLFFPAVSTSRDVTLPVPVINRELCTMCGKCAEFCQYGALTALADRLLFFPELCHSCGGCMLICPDHAISEEKKRIGSVTLATPARQLRLITGRLDIGGSQVVPVIRAAKEAAGPGGNIIYDCAPGTSCPVVETLEGCDACILVTESTPSGLHDLRLAFNVTAKLGVPAGVVINRSDGNDQPVLDFCVEQDLDVLLIIPFDREIAAIQCGGHLLAREQPAWEKSFLALWQKCRALTGRQAP